MPHKKFDKATSTTFHLVHRPQNDPKIHDASSSSMVFQELAPSQSHKIRNRRDLESELFDNSFSGHGASRIRDNEGEAAEHGIYYDDSEYDYMQHIRDLSAGSGNGENYFVEAKVRNGGKKEKGRMSLEEALRNSSLQEHRSESGASSSAENIFGNDMLPSKGLRHTSYQDQQDIPDALGGFQPDMDPRLKEVLEALEDDAYVDDEEEFFVELAQGGKEVSLEEFAEKMEGEEDGWESDTTEKPSKEYRTDTDTLIPSLLSHGDTTMSGAPVTASDDGDGDWMKEFKKFKADQNHTSDPPKRIGPPADVESSVLTGATSLSNGRRKKRKGAKTSSTGYSMTSSSLARTEGQTLLDARFDKIEEEYADDDGDVDMDNDSASIFSKGSVASKKSDFSQASNLSKASKGSWVSASLSQAPALTSAGFEDFMDEFLGGYSMSGKKRVKRGGYQNGMEQLDEVRKGLGPARVKGREGLS
ncbi:MAG: hypothetical protein Q9163_001460 [Psora crenata]